MANKLALIGFLVMLFFLSGCLFSSQRPAQPALCNQVNSQANKDSCFYQVAVRTGKVEYCQAIVDSNQKDHCLIDLAQGNSWISGNPD